MSSPKPLLLFDVDGPLSPWKRLTNKNFLQPKTRGKRAFQWEVHTMHPTGYEDEGLRVLLTPDHGEELAKISHLFTPVWATTWRHDANKWISPVVNFPKLPVIDFLEDGTEYNWKRQQNHRGSWKTLHIASWLDTYGWYTTKVGDVRRLPWVFVDDEVNRFDNSWLRFHWKEDSPSRPVAPRRLLNVTPHRGLDSKDFDELKEWGEKNFLHDA